MKKNNKLSKVLIAGGMAITLLAPMTLSTITPSNITPATTITAQAKRRHHHKRHHHYHHHKRHHHYHHHRRHESKKVRHYTWLRKHRMKVYKRRLHYDLRHHKDISTNYNLLNYVYKANPKTKLGRRMIQWPSC